MENACWIKFHIYLGFMSFQGEENILNPLFYSLVIQESKHFNFHYQGIYYKTFPDLDFLCFEMYRQI